MAGITSKNFDAADETRTPEKTKLEIVDLGGAKAMRMTAQPGWKWSECIKPVAGTDSCQSHHLGVVISGKLHVTHEDGTEMDMVPGHAYEIAPGHDAWVVGDDAFVAFEFDSSTAGAYAKG